MSGPTYETSAEGRFLRRAGADVVGMSTVPEVVVAREEGLRVLVLSLVTNAVVIPDHERSIKAEVEAEVSCADPRGNPIRLIAMNLMCSWLEGRWRCLHLSLCLTKRCLALGGRRVMWCGV